MANFATPFGRWSKRSVVVSTDLPIRSATALRADRVELGDKALEAASQQQVFTSDRT
ncbi:MAG: hypothetical protein ACI9G1_001827, partial [Pirellulaceae bacterium]